MGKTGTRVTIISPDFQVGTFIEFIVRFPNFMFHQKKGGIHAIYRYDMGTLGNYLVCRTAR